MQGNDTSGENDGGEVVSLSLQVSAYCVVMVIALVGNLLVIITYKNDQNELKKLVMSATICHMAVADLISTTIAIPSMITQLVYSHQWLIPGLFGEAICKLHSFAIEVGFAVSALSIAVIAVERFLSVFFPLRKIMTVKSAHVIGGAVWFACCCFYAPNLYSSVVITNGKNMYCSRPYSRLAKIKPWRKIEASFFALLFLVTLALYIAIVAKVTQKNSIPGRVVTENSHIARNRTNRRVIRQALGVITIHYLCWLPYLWIYNVCVVYQLKVKDVCYNMGIFHDFFMFFLGFSNAALNPILYTATNENFRKGCKAVLRNICTSCGVRISPISSVRSSRAVSTNADKRAAQNGQQEGEVHNLTHINSYISNNESGEMRRDRDHSKDFPRVIIIPDHKSDNNICMMKS